MISSISSLFVTVKTLKSNKVNEDKTVFEKKILVNNPKFYYCSWRALHNHLVDVGEEPPRALPVPLVLLSKLLDEHLFLKLYPINQQWDG